MEKFMARVMLGKFWYKRTAANGWCAYGHTIVEGQVVEALVGFWITREGTAYKVIPNIEGPARAFLAIPYYRSV